MTTDEPLHFLTGRNLLLRPLIDADFNGRYLAWLNDPEVNRYSRRRFFPSGEGELRSLESDSNLIHLAICLLDDGRHVGNISLGPINWIHRFGEIRIMIGDKSAWNRGVAREAIYLLAKHGLMTLGLRRIEAGSVNPAFNKAVVEKLGWRQEGLQRQKYFFDNEWKDAVLTAISSDEFSVLPELEPAA
ncbi:MAG: GNAT family N-acetyltransferase [Rhodospirillales bacterium]|nr:GNAT family N-acetyltransferase [Rhodospirillales bacterium]